MGENPRAGEFFCAPDPDGLRDFLRRKPRDLIAKVTSAREAIARFVHDGDYLATGGFGTNRIPVALLHEVVRQRRRHLGFAGHTATHDCQILVAGDCLDRCDVAYVVGLEARGLSLTARRAFESGRVQAREWSNGALAWRYKAAAMGLPFLPARVMLGTDTFAFSGCWEITCPYTGMKLAALPALSPDVALIHVQRADEYGNAQIDGITVADLDLARAAKHVVISTERLIPNELIRREPQRTAIPYFCVDAVVEVRYGGYPGNVAYEYFSDEEHLREWLAVEQDPDAFRAFLDRHIFGVPDFQAYLALRGGETRLAQLRAEEMLDGPREGA
ncbi:MAG: CoA transferase subunit A [Chloroflexi bacterium]|nr:CoA transferase subunit A [Chloroflexota bacterium]